MKKLLLQIKQYFCHHNMDIQWGLCKRCGYSDPAWTPARVYSRNHNFENRIEFMKKLLINEGEIKNG
jgi:hypothetical protein